MHSIFFLDDTCLFGLSAGLDFETRLIARPNAAKWLAAELVHWRYQVEPIVLGANTDPYQPIEKNLSLQDLVCEYLKIKINPPPL